MPPTTYLINKMLDHVFGVATYTPGSLVYLGFSTTAVNSSGSDTPLSEPSSGDGYERIEFELNDTVWDAAANGSLSNIISGSFAQSTASWGTLVSAFLVESQDSDANVLFYYTLNPSLPVPGNTDVTIGVGKITAAMS